MTLLAVVIELILFLVLVGVGLYLVNAVIPMDGKVKTILNVVVVVVVLLWVARAFGLLDGFHAPPRLR